MDYSTRFVLSYMVSPVKMGAEPLEMFREAARRAGTAPWVFVTDGLDVFPEAARKAFWRRAGRRLVHAVGVHMRNEFNHNNVHERLNGELKPLIRKRGGYKVANPVMVGLVVLGYDFFQAACGAERQDARRGGGHTYGRERQGADPARGRGGVDCQPYLPLPYNRPSAAMYVWRPSRQSGRARRLFRRFARVAGQYVGDRSKSGSVSTHIMRQT